jgi:hypothetical protein
MKLLTIMQLNTFIENGGFFPLAINHEDTVFVFCRTGAGHLGRTGKITVLTSSNGTEWEMRGIISKDNTDVRNPSAFIFPDGMMLLAAYKYNVYDKNGFSAPWNKTHDSYGTLVFSSKDGGYTWTEIQADFTQFTDKIGWSSPHGSMFMYNDRLLLSTYNKNGTFLLASKNRGQNWEIYSQITTDLLEPCVIKTPNNKLLAVMRTKRKGKWAEATVVSRLIDDQWTEPVAVTNPMQHPASLLVLSDNRILLTYADRNFQNQRILLKLSNDNGLTWSKEQQIGESFVNCDFGYPSTVEIEQGKLLTVFYVNSIENPYFNFGNKDFYTDAHVKGCYYLYSL